MASKYLGRDSAPFGEEVWAVLDAVMIEAAKSQLAGRRLLPLEGPYGLGLKAIPLPEEEVASGMFVSKTLPLVFLVEEFEVALRDLAAYERDGLAFNAQPVAEAAMALARREDELLFHGARRGSPAC